MASDSRCGTTIVGRPRTGTATAKRRSSWMLENPVRYAIEASLVASTAWRPASDAALRTASRRASNTSVAAASLIGRFQNRRNLRAAAGIEPGSRRLRLYRQHDVVDRAAHGR